MNVLNDQLKGRDQQSKYTHKPAISCLQEIHFKFNDIDTLKVKGLKKIYHATIDGKKWELLIQ
jgi:hypothetical protein